jgi:hypothetical protein
MRQKKNQRTSRTIKNQPATFARMKQFRVHRTSDRIAFIAASSPVTVGASAERDFGVRSLQTMRISAHCLIVLPARSAQHEVRREGTARRFRHRAITFYRFRAFPCCMADARSAQRKKRQ